MHMKYDNVSFKVKDTYNIYVLRQNAWLLFNGCQWKNMLFVCCYSSC